jgi:uncharacterized repeat protein (TIGR01451 family)
MKRKLLLFLSLLSFNLYAQREILTEGFEGEWPPVGWTVYQNNVDTGRSWQQSHTDVPVYTGEHSAYILPSSPITESAIDWIVSPPVLLRSHCSLELYCKAIPVHNGGGKYRIATCPADADPSDLSNFTTGPFTTLSNDRWHFRITGLVGYLEAPSEYRIAIIHEVSAGVGNADGFVIDDIAIRHDCQPPFNLSVNYSEDPSNPDPVIGWAETSRMYEYEIIPADQEPTGTGILTGDHFCCENHVTVSGYPSGAYKFYARSICNETYSSEWAGPCYFSVMNRVTGKVAYDSNGSGDCDGEDTGVPGMEMQLTINNETQSVYTNDYGDYAYYYVPEEVNQITFLPYPGAAFPGVSAITENVNFHDGNFAEEINICLPQPLMNKDLMVNIIPLSCPRPGVEATYILKIWNKGTEVIEAATASMTFNDTKLSIHSASSPSTVLGNQINFSLENLLPLSNQEIFISFMVAIPPENIGGEVLVFDGSISPTQDDALPEDNHFTMNQTIVNSFDPNDITVHEGSEIFEDQVNDYLTYTIRFQNTGSAEAFNIFLENELDAKLDWETFQPITSSHRYMVTRNGAKVKFTYEDINLPHEDADEPGSHGYVTYRIKPKSTSQVGDIIVNSAKIYFDFNEPIITNNATTEIVNNLGMDEKTISAAYLHPNPVKDKLKITVVNTSIISANVYDMNGRICLDRFNEDNTIDMTGLTPGLYIVKIITDGGTSVHKIIKE